MLSYIHDPEDKYKEQAGVMSDTTTAMRDPVFFRWHKMIDELCCKLKNRLPPYPESDLLFEDISISSLVILNESNQPIHELNTFWQKTSVNLQNGMDFHVAHPVYVTFTHLNYRHFKYSLVLT